MGLGLGVDMYPYLCWGFNDNPGTDDIDLCRDCIQTSDVFLQDCLQFLACWKRKDGYCHYAQEGHGGA